WSSRLNLLFGRFNYTATGICDSTHLRWFTRQTAVGLVTDAGLVVQNVRYTAGLGLPVYRSRFLRLIPGPLFRELVHRLTRQLPKLFACQFVINARKPDQ